LEIREREQDGIAILDLMGELRGGPVDEVLFKGAIDRSVETGHKNVLLNFEEVKWINSTGLGFIVSAFSEMSKVGGTLKMCSPNERIMNVFTTTRFHMVIGIHDTEEEALAAFSQN